MILDLCFEDINVDRGLKGSLERYLKYVLEISRPHVKHKPIDDRTKLNFPGGKKRLVFVDAHDRNVCEELIKCLSRKHSLGLFYFVFLTSERNLRSNENYSEELIQNRFIRDFLTCGTTGTHGMRNSFGEVVSIFELSKHIRNVEKKVKDIDENRKPPNPLKEVQEIVSSDIKKGKNKIKGPFSVTFGEKGKRKVFKKHGEKDIVSLLQGAYIASLSPLQSGLFEGKIAGSHDIQREVYKSYRRVYDNYDNKKKNQFIDIHSGLKFYWLLRDMARAVVWNPFDWLGDWPNEDSESKEKWKMLFIDDKPDELFLEGIQCLSWFFRHGCLYVAYKDFYKTILT